MIQQIISDLNNKFQDMLPDVQRDIPTLEDFTIIPGSMFGLDPNVNSELRDEIERAKYYIVLRFSSSGNRQQAVAAFKQMMEDKLGLPSTNDVNDEVLPPYDYEETYSRHQNDYDDVIDIDTDGNVAKSITQYHGTSLGNARPKYYAVEFRVEAPRGLPRPMHRQSLGGRQVWNPHRSIGGGRNSRRIGY